MASTVRFLFAVSSSLEGDQGKWEQGDKCGWIQRTAKTGLGKDYERQMVLHLFSGAKMFSTSSSSTTHRY